MRTQRTNGSTIYNYTYHGSQLTHMTCGSNSLHFYYDASGMPLSVVYNGTTYYYILSLQGDVVAILDSSGVSVVEYTYDAWGRLLSTSGSMAGSLGLHNPLRYRGYVYDRETGLYCLQSRYYNPTICRFISADSISFLGADGTLQSYNLFAYCGNNPVMGYDPTGYFAITSFVIYLAATSLISWGAAQLLGGQIVGGASSMLNGGSAIYSGIGLLSFGPAGWIAGGSLILIGAGTILLGANEVAAGITGTNYMQEWTGFSDELYNGLYVGLNIASSVGTIAGNIYMRYANLSGTTNPGRYGKPLSRYSTYDRQGGLKQYRFFDIKGAAWFDIDFNHSGNMGFPHYHPWSNGSRFEDHFTFWQFIGWLIGR